MWSTLDVGTASLKFRQSKSAVCDAFVVILFLRRLRGCSLLCRGLRSMWFALRGAGASGYLFFLPLYCWVGGWGLVIWL